MLEGKRIYVISSVPSGNGRKVTFEGEHKIAKFRRYLPIGEGRKEALIQFWAIQGGMRTVAVRDIVDVA